MPVGFMTLQTATQPELEKFHDDPQGLRDFVSGVVERAGAELVELYFDIGKERAYALVEELDDYSDVKAVSRILGADGFLKMTKVDGVTKAMARESRFRRNPESAA
jgi:hypothetical protein